MLGGRLSLNDLIRSEQQRGRDHEAEFLRGLEVENELEFGGLLDRYLGGQGSAEDSIGERPRTSREGDVIDGVRDERAVVVRPERNETAVACELRRFTGGQP